MMEDDEGRRLSAIEARLVEARAHLATLRPGKVEYRDALSAVRHLERAILGGDGLPPTMNPYGFRRHR
jgi:hypothetical protein